MKKEKIVKPEKTVKLPEVKQPEEQPTVDQMNSLLAKLAETAYWPAIRWLIEYHTMMAKDALVTLDVYKDPTTTARQQGIIMGLAGLVGYIMTEHEKMRKKKEGVEETEILRY